MAAFIPPLPHVRWCVVAPDEYTAATVSVTFREVAAAYPGILEPAPFVISTRGTAPTKDVLETRAPRYTEETDSSPQLPYPCTGASMSKDAGKVEETRGGSDVASASVGAGAGTGTGAGAATAAVDRTWTDVRRCGESSKTLQHEAMWPTNRRAYDTAHGRNVDMFHTLVVSVDGAFNDRPDPCFVHVIDFPLAKYANAREAEDLCTANTSAADTTVNCDDTDVVYDDEAVLLWRKQLAERERVAKRTQHADESLESAGVEFRRWVRVEAKLRRQDWIAWARFPCATQGRAVVGRLTLWKRPTAAEVVAAAREGATMVVTLMHDPRAEAIIKSVTDAGMTSVWCPLDHSSNKEGDLRANEPAWRTLALSLRRAEEEIRRGGSVMVHCSAGLNRSGVFTYSLLRRLGLGHDAAFDAITAIRPVTNRCIGKVRYQVGRAMLGGEGPDANEEQDRAYIESFRSLFAGHAA